MANLTSVIPDVLTRVDTFFIRARHCGVYILRCGSQAVIVEAGSTVSVPPILAALDKLEIKREDITHLFITHAHLDHSGGTGLLLQALPSCVAICHPSALPHIVDPFDKLVPAAIGVYGQDVFQRDYPGILCAPSDRVVAAEHDSVYGPEKAELQLRCLHSHGHAYHHAFYYSEKYHLLFGGDGLGFTFDELGGCPLLCTSPSQYDGKAWRGSLELARTLDIEFLLVTHFDICSRSQLPKRWASIAKQLDDYDRIVETANSREEVEEMYKEVIRTHLAEYGQDAPDAVATAWVYIIGDVNVDGLWYRVQRRLARK